MLNCYSRARAACLLGTAAILAACGDDNTAPPPPPPPDTRPPLVWVVFPTDDREIDRDGDGLIDVELGWSDNSDSVDVEGITVLATHGVNGPATDETNLLEVWEVSRRDASGAVLEETIENLLHPGDQELVITVADTAGNVTTDTIPLDVDPAEFHKTLQLGVGGLVGGITVCPDEPMAYVGVGRSMAVIDLEALELVAVDTRFGAEAIRTLCVAGDPIVYATSLSFLWPFYRATHSWGEHIPSSYPGAGIVQSRSDPNLIYLAEAFSGDVGIVDRSTGERLGTIGLPQSISHDEFVADLEILPGDAKIYVPRQDEGGIIVADPSTGAILKRFDLDASQAGWGRVYNMALSSDDARLYLGVARGLPVGVWEIDPATDEVLRAADTSGWEPIDLSVSPDGTKLFVVTQDALGVQSQNFLLDLERWQVIASFPRPRPEGEARYDLAVVWHPNGKLVLAGHDGDVDIYLSRE